jgi:hypothetical protein
MAGRGRRYRRSGGAPPAARSTMSRFGIVPLVLFCCSLALTVLLLLLGDFFTICVICWAFCVVYLLYAVTVLPLTGKATDVLRTAMIVFCCCVLTSAAAQLFLDEALLLLGIFLAFCVSYLFYALFIPLTYGHVCGKGMADLSMITWRVYPALLGIAVLSALVFHILSGASIFRMAYDGPLDSEYFRPLLLVTLFMPPGCFCVMYLVGRIFREG